MTTPAPRASRLSADRRNEILTRTVELIIEHGYHATTIEQIAASTGSSKATLYRQWVDKPTLVITALKETSAIDLGAIDTGRLASDLDELMGMLAHHAHQNIPLVLTLAEASRHDLALREALHRATFLELATLDTILENAKQRGEVASGAPTRYVKDLIMGALFGSVLFGGAPEQVTETSLREYARAVIVPLLALPEVVLPKL